VAAVGQGVTRATPAWAEPSLVVVRAAPASAEASLAAVRAAQALAEAAVSLVATRAAQATAEASLVAAQPARECPAPEVHSVARADWAQEARLKVPAGTAWRTRRVVRAVETVVLLEIVGLQERVEGAAWL
jgi:hypothetical protein